MKKIICFIFTTSRAWLRTNLVFSKSLVFIWGMIFSYGFVKIGVINILIDYFSPRFFGENLRKAVMVGNMQEGLSSILVVVTHFSESYVGHFSVIILCTASIVIGLMLLWVSAQSHLPIGIFYLAVILIAFGDAMEPTLEDFLECQLEQKVKRSADIAANSASQICDEGENKVGRVTFLWWWDSAFLTGSLLASFWFGSLSVSASFLTWTTQFKIATLFMLAAYFWFYLGCFSYFLQEPSGSPLYKMYKVFKAAMWKLKLRRPALEVGYHWKNLIQKEYIYRRRGGQVRVKPHVPSLWRWLDKAAILEDNSIGDDEKCSVEEVREVKYVASLTHFGITLLPCSLVKAAGSTFFIERADNLDNDFHISLLLLLKLCMRELVVLFCWIFKLNRQRQITIIRIAAGMICAVLCCFVACGVDLIIRRNHKVSIGILIPQYILLGLTEGLACKGFQKFFRNHVPESMWSLEEAYTGFVLGVGNFLLIPFVYFFTGWFKDSIDKCRLYDYYLMLGFLNIAALLVFGYYSWTYAYNEGQEQIVAAQVHHTVPEGSNDATAAGSSTMSASEEQPQRMVMQQSNAGTKLISRSSSLVRRDQQQ